MFYLPLQKWKLEDQDFRLLLVLSQVEAHLGGLPESLSLNSKRTSFFFVPGSVILVK